MQIISQTISGLKFAEIRSETIVVSGVEDATGLMGGLYYDGYEGIVLYEENITAAFFDLKTKIAGDILQKFFNYRMGLVIVGDFSKYTGKSLGDFIFESNKGKLVNFSGSLASFTDKQ